MHEHVVHIMWSPCSAISQWHSSMLHWHPCSGSFLGLRNRTSGTGIALRSCRLLMLPFNDQKCSKLGIPSASSVALCDISSFICGFFACQWYIHILHSHEPMQHACSFKCCTCKATRGLILLITIASLIKNTAQMSQTCLAVVRLHVHCWFAVHNGDLGC